MTLNIYRVEPGRPMIYSLASAKSFIEQTKHPIEIHTPDMKKGYYFIIAGGRFQTVRREYIGEIGIDTELYSSTGEEAVKDVYQIRKYINQKFNR